MSRKSLIRLMTRSGKARPAAAADELDRAVEHILRALKKGQPVQLPGLGRLVPAREQGTRLIPGRGDGERND